MPRLKFSAFARHLRVGLAFLLLCSPSICAQTAAKNNAAGRAPPEQRTARAFKAARANPLDLRAFLVRMPKGADLHNHLSGAIYAESWIRAAREDGLCVDLATLSFRPAASPAAAAPAAVDPSTAAASTAAPPTCG